MDTREYSIQYASKDLMFITILQDYLLPITKAGFIGLTIYKHGNVTTPYACDLCEKSFSDQFKLDRHQSVHKGKLHQCSFCEKAFSQKQALTSHIKDKHSDNPDCSDNPDYD